MPLRCGSTPSIGRSAGLLGLCEGEELDIQQFAEQQRVKLRRDNCGEEIIPGRPRNATRQEDRRHIFQHSDDGRLFGVCLLLTGTRAFGNATRRLLALGFTPGQTGDTEGILLFDPSNSEQAKAAIREAGIRIRVPASPERLAQLETARRIAHTPV
jgi:hypothetical protein